MFHVEQVDSVTYSFLQDLGLSEGQLRKICDFLALLEKWNNKINLIGKSEWARIWRRHVLDSAQLLPFLAGSSEVIDLGSGSGFPGIVLSVCGVPRTTLVESDQRKAAFLKQAAINLDLDCRVACNKIESLERKNFSANPLTFTARGLGSVSAILELTQNLRRAGDKYVLPKGQSAAAELGHIEKNTVMTAVMKSSISSTTGNVIILKVDDSNAGDLRC